jgi:aerobic-type carbon monoxide dehydrogenase small subunit (CoxS/CutS family)
MEIKIKVNGIENTITTNPDTPLLWVLREKLRLTGTKYGCGISQCGACTVHVDGQPVRSCSTKVASVVGKSITTIEGLSQNSSHAVQEAWKELTVPQCGYCQSGQILSAAALLEKNPNPSDTEIDRAMSGNLCRCGTYNQIRAGIHRASEIMRS